NPTRNDGGENKTLESVDRLLSALRFGWFRRRRSPFPVLLFISQLFRGNVCVALLGSLTTLSSIHLPGFAARQPARRILGLLAFPMTRSHEEYTNHQQEADKTHHELLLNITPFPHSPQHPRNFGRFR